MNRSRLIFIAAAVILLGVAGVLAYRSATAPERGGVVSSSGQAMVGGPFSLTDQDGQPVTEALLKGKWTAVFFGYTYCPDVCPLTLQTLGEAQKRMGPRGDALQTVFITVDPQRDTAPQLKAYLTSPVFPRHITGRTGTPEQIAAAAKAYRAPYSKEGEGDGYLMNHASMLYLMDPEGRFNRVIPAGLSPDDVARQIASAMQQR
jgi:protein SCO1/2